MLPGRLTLALLVVPAVARGKESRCRHGTFDHHTGVCDCFDHWSTAGITDTVDFMEGVCEQYLCQSDSICQKVLGIQEASCPVKQWNCYCGWRWAFENFGHGHETHGEHGAECMGVMYTFSVWATEWVRWMMSFLWAFFLGAAVVAIPFGRKRCMCDHHWPSLSNGLRGILGCPSTCRGQCVHSTEYDLDAFQDDFAWTLYFLEVGIWTYIFLGTVLFIALFIWSVVLWMAVVVIIVVMTLFGICGLFGDGNAGCSDFCNGVDIGDHSAVLDAPGEPYVVDTGAASSADYEVFYWGGPYPLDPWYAPWGANTGAGVGQDEGNCCGYVCSPVAWLLFVFPVMPENAWGGIVGRCFGTHRSTPPEQLYAGGSPFIEFFGLGWRRTNDLHGDASWRRSVRNFLLGDDPLGTTPMSWPPGEDSPLSRQELLPGSAQHLLREDGSQEDRQVLRIGRAHAVCIERAFGEDDLCVQSSFDDYKNNHCWICMGGNEEWDMWLSCKHLFCKDCSTTMLRRRMPCPLCRVSSSAVLRGRAFQARGQNSRR